MMKFPIDEQDDATPGRGVEEESLLDGLDLLGKTRRFGRGRSAGPDNDDPREMPSGEAQD